MRVRAFTMVELVIYFALSVMVLGVVFSVFFTGQRNFEASSSSYLVSQDAEAALRWLKADLQEACLSSIRVYPNTESPDSPPGLSMASPRNLDNEFQISKHGSPDWSTYVYYTVDEEGKLNRWMAEHEFNGQPTASSTKPEAEGNRQRERVILRNIVQPGDELENLGKLSDRGGFDAQFVRYSAAGDEILTDWNPGQLSSGEIDDGPDGRSSQLIALLITVAMSNYRERNVSYVQLPVRVMPRH